MHFSRVFYFYTNYNIVPSNGTIYTVAQCYLIELILVSRKDNRWFVCLMLFNATFNNISVLSWRSVLLVEETGGRYKRSVIRTFSVN